MKRMKKVVASVLATSMVLGMSMTTMAASGKADDKGIISVSGIVAESGLDVLAHPIVEAKYENSGSFSGYHAIYGDATVSINPDTCDITVSDDQLTALLALVDEDKAYEMDASADGTVYTEEVPVGTYLVQISGAESRIYSNVVVSVKYTNENGQNGLEAGAVNVAGENAWTKIQELPTIDKAILENGAEVNGNTADYNETVNYQIETTIPYYGGAYPVYKITDTLAGLSLNSDIVVKVGNATLKAGEDYDLTLGTDNFVLDFAKDYNYTLNEYQGQTLVVTYSAKVDADADLNDGGNVNDATLEFTRDSKVEGNDDSVNDKTKTYTFDIDAVGSNEHTHAIITKYGQTSTTESAPLENAEFTLYRDDACTVVYSNDVFNGVVRSDANGQLTMKGLDEGTYYLKETEAPEGYTLNNTVYKIDITAEIDENGELESWEIKVLDTVIGSSEGLKTNTFEINSESKEVSVTKTETGIQNTKIASLPSTGGIGTAIFTFGGCGIMIAAAFLLMANKKREEA